MDLTSIVVIVVLGLVGVVGFYVYRKKGALNKETLSKETLDEFVEKASASAKSRVKK